MARGWNVAIFLAAWTLIHCVTEAALPMPNVGDVSDKLTYFAGHRDDYDAIFVGSSRVSAQIAPGVFDAQVTAKTGRPMHSFNFGAPSMFLPESLYVIDRILAQHSARLRWMFIELDEPRLRVEEHAGLVRREVYWHGGSETALMSVLVLTSHGFHLGDRLRMLAHQWALCGRRWSQTGRAHEWLVGNAAPARTAALGAAGDGYTPYRATLGDEIRGGGKDVRGELETFARATSALEKGKRGQGADRAASPTLLRWLLAQKIRALRAGGVEPVFVIAPVTTGEEEFLRLAREGVARPLFAFNDPAIYPELYETDMRADTMHLNAPGAVRFTRALADEFADYRLAAATPP